MKVTLRHFLFSSLSLWALATGFGVYFLLHFNRFIKFGVDLVGGTYITLEVHPEKAVELELVNRMQFFVDKLKKDNKDLPISTIVKDEVGYLQFVSPEAARKADDFFHESQAIVGGALRYLGERQDDRLLFKLTPEEVATIKREALYGNIHVLEKRLNPVGAAEITIVPQGDRHIVVELPNIHDIRQAKTMIGKTALLEIKLVEDMGPSQPELLKKYGGKLPENLMIVSGAEHAGHELFYVVPKFTEITGQLLKDASMEVGGSFGGEPLVKFEFKPEGGKKFYELTSNNIGRHIAITLDNVVITAPVVQSAIENEGTITGSFTPESAQNLATLLKSGAFVAPVTFEEDRHIGPSLGYQSIRNGLLACIVGLLLLFIFALIVYRTAGLIAFLVLLFNLLLIFFAFAALGATLTLPGIAGMLLTIGMAIDASILIYERIREELSAGSPLRKAVDTGFSGALAVILDANMTHFLVALVLYKLGAGPIKGFAITMIIGILSTLTTGLLLLKAIFNFIIQGLGVNRINFG